VSDEVLLTPGRMPLAEWQAIHDGAPIVLDSVARADVEAGRAALAAILSRNGLLPPLDLANSPSVADIIAARGEILPDGDLRLFSALKLASLAQGVSGVRWEVAEALAALIQHDLLPAIPIGSNDRMALAHLFAALTGSGEILVRGRIRPAADTLREAELRPLSLNPRERSALLSGTTLTLATTLSALFSAERIFQAAMIAAALSESAGANMDGALHLSVHRLYRQRGQYDVAATLSALLSRAEPAEPVPTQTDHAPIFRAGAALDLLRQAAVLLERAANGVSEDRFVIWQSAELVPGAEDLTSLAHASDLIALSLSTLGTLASERIAAVGNGAAAKATPLVKRSHKQAGTPSLDPAQIARLMPLLETTSEIVAIELLDALQRGSSDDEALSEPLGRVVDSMPRTVEPEALKDKDIEAIASLVRSGAVAASAGVPLPSLVSGSPVRPVAR
jgi:histidine ammonia-lyase